MKSPRLSWLAAVALITLLPLASGTAISAVARASTEATQLSTDDVEAIGARMRQTGAQMRADLKQARERIHAQKAQQAAQRRQVAEQVRIQAQREAAEQELARVEAAQQAERKRQLALAAQRKAASQQTVALAQPHTEPTAQDKERAAKARAEQALKAARSSMAGQAFADSDQ
jgi:hypothetical protein